MKTTLRFEIPEPDADGVLICHMTAEDGTTSTHQVHNPEGRKALEEAGKIGIDLPGPSR